MYDLRGAPEQHCHEIEANSNQQFLSRICETATSLISDGQNNMEQPDTSADEMLSRELNEKTFCLIQNNQSEILFRSRSKASRKRRVYSQVHGDPKKSARRFRANDRERRRMESLNSALDALKGCIPLPKNNKRMTKLRVLRYACNYIKSLSDLLGVAAGKYSYQADNHSMSKESRINGLSVGQRLEILSHTGRYYQNF